MYKIRWSTIDDLRYPPWEQFTGIPQKTTWRSRNDTTILLWIAILTSFVIFPTTYTYCHVVARMSGKARVYTTFVQNSLTLRRDDVTVKVWSSCSVPFWSCGPGTKYARSGKMSKDIRMAIRNNMVVSFLLCLVAFLYYRLGIPINLILVTGVWNNINLTILFRIDSSLPPHAHTATPHYSLSNNEIPNAGVSALAGALRVNQSLEELEWVIAHIYYSVSDEVVSLVTSKFQDASLREPW